MNDGSRNYYFVNGQAFTEDNVLVYNIYAYRIPKKINRREVTSYFEQFGELAEVRINNPKYTKRGGNATKVGFVNFVNASDAAKVLAQSEHFIQLKSISVNACDSWSQPDGRKDKTEMQNKISEQEEQEAPISADVSVYSKNILDLNDDCLEHICKMLKLREQVHFSRVCRRFCDIFVMRAKTEYKIFDMGELEGLTLWEIRDFFKSCGKFIEKLIANHQYNYRDRVTNFITLYCSNVKSLRFETVTMKKGHLIKIEKTMKSLTDLSLQCCALTDNALFPILKLPELETLSLANNYELTGKNLHNFKRLVSLDLSNCCNIIGKHLIKAIKSSPQLKYLNIKRCDRINTHVVNQIVKFCNNLTQLQMSGVSGVNYECVAKIPQLTHLDLVATSSMGNVRVQLFEQLVEHKSTQLEHLKICAKNFITYNTAKKLSELENLKYLYCPNNVGLNDDCLEMFGCLKHLEELTIKKSPSITNAGLLSLVRQCTELNHLNIEYCTNINNQFVNDVVKLMKTRGSQRKHLLVCNVVGTGVERYVLNDTEYENTAAYLKIIYEGSFDNDVYDIDSDDYDDDDDDDFYTDDEDDMLDDHDFDLYDSDDDFYANGYNYGSDMEEDVQDELFHIAYNMFGYANARGNDMNDVW